MSFDAGYAFAREHQEVTMTEQPTCPSCGGKAESTYQDAATGQGVHECENGHTWLAEEPS